jgi:hypothetical protein
MKRQNWQLSRTVSLLGVALARATVLCDEGLLVTELLWQNRHGGTPHVLALRRLRQKDHKFQTLCQQTNNPVLYKSDSKWQSCHAEDSIQCSQTLWGATSWYDH